MNLQAQRRRVQLVTPSGESYHAKLDGRDYPAKGRHEYNSVSLKRIHERTTEETGKLDGRVVLVLTLTVGSGGKSMTVVRDY